MSMVGLLSKLFGRWLTLLAPDIWSWMASCLMVLALS